MYKRQEEDPCFEVGDYIYVPGVRKALDGDLKDIKAYVLGKEGSSIRTLDLYIADMTAEEREDVYKRQIEYRARNVRGEWIWLRCRGKMLRDKDGQPELFAGMISNLGKKNQIDHMTGLYNKYEFEGNIKKYLAGRKSKMCIRDSGYISGLLSRPYGRR